MHVALLNLCKDRMPVIYFHNFKSVLKSLAVKMLHPHLTFSHQPLLFQFPETDLNLT